MKYGLFLQEFLQQLSNFFKEKFINFFLKISLKYTKVKYLF